jgi:hypothetical protein
MHYVPCMATRGQTHPNLIAGGIGLVALGPLLSVVVFAHETIRGSDIGYLVVFQVLLSLAFCMLAWAYRSSILSIGASEHPSPMARPLRAFAAANLVFALAYLVSSADYLRREVAYGFDGWAMVVWLIAQAVTCVGFGVATVGLWTSARALGSADGAVIDGAPVDVPA